MTRSDQPAVNNIGERITRWLETSHEPDSPNDALLLIDARMEIDRLRAEIERLRAAVQIAAGKLSTLPPFDDWHPEIIYKALLEDGAEEARRG